MVSGDAAYYGSHSFTRSPMSYDMIGAVILYIDNQSLHRTEIAPTPTRNHEVKSYHNHGPWPMALISVK